MIDKLEMFLAVAKEGHVGRAAATIGVTQPTLSAGIKQLEESLGVLLIFRGSRYGGLTPEGQQALVWARRIVGDTRQLRDEMRAVRHGLSGRLRIAVIPTALTWAARISARFGAAHPNVGFTILSRTSAEILQMIDDLEVDAGITYLDNEALGRVLAVPLYTERYRFVTAAEGLLGGRDSVTWAELNQVRLCLLTPDMQNRRIMDGLMRGAGAEPRAALESNSQVTLLAHVLTGEWATVLPERVADTLALSPRLRRIPITDPDATHEIGLVLPHREPMPVLAAALLAEARLLTRKP